MSKWFVVTVLVTVLVMADFGKDLVNQLRYPNHLHLILLAISSINFMLWVWIFNQEYTKYQENRPKTYLVEIGESRRGNAVDYIEYKFLARGKDAVIVWNISLDKVLEEKQKETGTKWSVYNIRLIERQ